MALKGIVSNDRLGDMLLYAVLGSKIVDSELSTAQHYYKAKQGNSV
jgi:hypothetical protein